MPSRKSHLCGWSSWLSIPCLDTQGRQRIAGTPGTNNERPWRGSDAKGPDVCMRGMRQRDNGYPSSNRTHRVECDLSCPS